jgi:CYTH domain-containing protein
VGPPTTIEIERKWLVTSTPPVDDCGTELRQGYLAVDGDVNVRVRAEGGDAYSCTIKAGAGATRLELEWPLTREQFELAWRSTGARRVHKTRYRVPLADGLVAELDRFHGELAPLLVVEVEFPSTAAMDDFEPPDWFGDDVTDDARYANASLALAGAPPGTAARRSRG